MILEAEELALMRNISREYINLVAQKAIQTIQRNPSSATKPIALILAIKCPFPKLDFLGRQIGQAGYNESRKFFKAFDHIIDYNALGGFVIVGQALSCFLADHFEEVMQKSREYINVSST